MRAVRLEKCSESQRPGAAAVRGEAAAFLREEGDATSAPIRRAAERRCCLPARSIAPSRVARCFTIASGAGPPAAAPGDGWEWRRPRDRRCCSGGRGAYQNLLFEED